MSESREQKAESTYRLLSAKLRVQRGAGREDLVVARPVSSTAKGEAKRDRNGNVSYLDSDEAPTLVTFDEHCQVRTDQLLRIGAIAEYEAPPESPATASGKGPRSSHGGAQEAKAPVQAPESGLGPGGAQEAIR